MAEKAEAPHQDIPVRERLIFALDVPTAREAKALVDVLGDTVCFYKVGLQLFLADGCFELVRWLRERDRKVFVDLKLFDVPQTVGSAVAQLRDRDVTFTTVHGNDAILEAAVEAAEGRVGILAVTALTSLDRRDMEDLGFQADISQLVLSRARRALEIGCAGVVSSGREAPELKRAFGSALVVVVPGIRPAENREADDQKRTVDVEEAFRDGADYIVVGRPIRKAPDPREAAEAIQERIARLFA